MAAAPAEIRPLTDREFELFRQLILEDSGIHLSEAKKNLLVARLTPRLRLLGLDSFSAYYQRVVDDGDEEERVRMLDCVTTNETSFFRVPHHFEFLEQQIVPRLISRAKEGSIPHRVRVWSAACSTGEEPYSLAMVLCWYLPSTSGWDVQIVASDLSTRVLEKAQQGRWPIEKASKIPPHYLKRFMRRGVRSEQGVMMAGSEIRSVIRFSRISINEETSFSEGTFDFIFCCNVLIYFTNDVRAQVVRELLRHLTPGGHLFLGESESLRKNGLNLRSVCPNTYEHVP